MYNITLKFLCFQHPLIDWICMFSSQPQTSLKEPAYDNGLGHTISIISNLCITVYTNVICRYHMVFILKSVFKLKVYHIFKRLKTAISSRRHAQIVNLKRWLLPDARMQPTAMMAGTWQLPVQEGVNNMARWSSVFDIRYKAHISCHVIHINWLGGVIDLIYCVTW